MAWQTLYATNMVFTNSMTTATRNDSTNWNGFCNSEAGSEFEFTLDRSSGGDNFPLCIVNDSERQWTVGGDTSQDCQFGVLIEGTLTGTGNLYKTEGSSWASVGTVNMSSSTKYKFYKSGSSWNFSVDGVDKITGLGDSNDYYLQCRNQNQDLSTTLLSGDASVTLLNPPQVAYI